MGQAAERVGVAPNTWSNWEKGKRVPQIGKAEKIVELLRAESIGTAPRKALQPRTTSKTKRQSDGINVLARAILDEDWDLAREAYYLLSK